MAEESGKKFNLQDFLRESRKLDGVWIDKKLKIIIAKGATIRHSIGRGDADFNPTVTVKQDQKRWGKRNKALEKANHNGPGLVVYLDWSQPHYNRRERSGVLMGGVYHHHFQTGKPMGIGALRGKINQESIEFDERVRSMFKNCKDDSNCNIQ